MLHHQHYTTYMHLVQRFFENEYFLAFYVLMYLNFVYNVYEPFTTNIFDH